MTMSMQNYKEMFEAAIRIAELLHQINAGWAANDMPTSQDDVDNIMLNINDTLGMWGYAVIDNRSDTIECLTEQLADVRADRMAEEEFAKHDTRSSEQKILDAVFGRSPRSKDSR